MLCCLYSTSISVRLSLVMIVTNQGDLLALLQARGMHLEHAGPYGARWAFRDPAVERAYREETHGGAEAAISLYFADHWLEVVRPKHVAVLARLRATARCGFNPRPKLGDLAASITLSEDAMRRFVQWWETPQPNCLEWWVMRAYVLHIQPRPGLPYLFRVLLDDVPRDLEQFDLKAQALARRGELPLTYSAPRLNPSQNQTGVGSPADEGVWFSDPLAAKPDGSGFATPSRLNPAESAPQNASQNQTGVGSPHTPLHEPKPKQPKAATAIGTGGDYTDPLAYPYPEESQAAALLAERGIRSNSIQWVLSQPEGPYWAVRWCTWIESKRGLRSPADFLFSRLRGALRGVAEDREPPTAWLDRLDARRQVAKQRERTTAIVAGDRATPVGPRIAATAAAEPWQRFLAELRRQDPSLWGHLRYWVRAVDFDDQTLLLTPEPGKSDRLARELRHLVPIANALGFLLAFSDGRSA